MISRNSFRADTQVRENSSHLAIEHYFTGGTIQNVSSANNKSVQDLTAIHKSVHTKIAFHKSVLEVGIDIFHFGDFQRSLNSKVRRDIVALELTGTPEHFNSSPRPTIAVVGFDCFLEPCEQGNSDGSRQGGIGRFFLAPGSASTAEVDLGNTRAHYALATIDGAGSGSTMFVVYYSTGVANITVSFAEAEKESVSTVEADVGLLTRAPAISFEVALAREST